MVMVPAPARPRIEDPGIDASSRVSSSQWNSTFEGKGYGIGCSDYICTGSEHATEGIGATVATTFLVSPGQPLAVAET
jgi:hypothetical protein